ASPQDIVIITTPPTSPTSGSGNGSGSTSTTGSGSSTSIAPLTPVVLVGSSNGRARIVVIVIPQPLVANFGPSTAPVTTQAILSAVPGEEATRTPTHFGQGLDE